MINLHEEYNKKHYLYTPLFCEENIWQLLLSFSQSSKKVDSSKMWALIITNPDQKIVLLNQCAAEINQPIIWDYHVVLLAEIHQQPFIFDFDTRLPFITPLHQYLQHTFIFSDNLPQELTPYIRKIPAHSYLERFYSDRLHMENQIEKSEFPSWPIINANKKLRIKLADYLATDRELDDNSQVFKVPSLTALEQWLIHES